MKKLGKQLLAILLVLVMILQIIPLSAFAEEEEEYLAPEPETVVESNMDTQTETVEDKRILFEETSLREENVKHFRMEDGTYLAVRFDAPVHYSDENGKWTDFDNTLIPVTSEKDDKITAYRVENGNSLRTFAASGADDLLSLQKGEYGLTITPESDTEFAQRTEQEELDSKSIIENEPVAMTVLDAASCGSVEEDPLLAQVQPDKIYSALEYENAFDGATLRYENFGNTVKESIVIPSPQDNYCFAFHIETTGLNAELQDDRSVTFASSAGETIYYIPAPYLMDAKNEISYDVKYSLEGGENSYTLTVEVDAEWMEAEDRAYPVVIDPTITEGNKTDAEVTATYISSGYPGGQTPNAAGLYVGNNGNDNQMVHTLVHINDLIDLPEGSQVTYMGFSLYQFAYEKQQGGADSLDVALYPMYSLNGSQTSNITTSQWQNLMNVVTWNAVYGSAPYYVFNANKLVTDFSTVKSATNNHTVTWDITLLAKEWYEYPSSNLGFVLRPLLPGNQVTSRVSFYGPDTTTGVRPQLTVTYRNSVGVEPQYSYQTAGIGRAGAAYISDATLHLTTIVPLISSPSDVMPFSLSLVYNSVYGNREFKYDSAMLHTKPFTNMNLGAGWKLSAQETVCSITINNTTYLIYTDADGTEHYFRYSDGYYRDEDGLGLKISVSGTNYTMTDDYDNTKFFGNGYLKQLYDANGNYIYFNYNGNAQLTTITRQNNGSSAPETLATLTYEASTNRLIQITNEAGKMISLNYSTLGNSQYYSITSITYPDSVAANYAYDVEDNDIYRMVSAYDTEAAYGVAFGYEPDGTICVCSEYIGTSTPRTYGASFNATKLSHNQTRYRYNGSDRTWNSDDDIYTFKVLDSTGRTINSYSTDKTQRHVLGVEVSSFTQNSETSKQNNRLTANVSAGQQGINLLDNASVENGNYSVGAAYAWHSDTNYTGAELGQTTYLGALSLCLHSTYSTATPRYWEQTVAPDENGDYTFSGYVYVPSATTIASNGGIKLSILNSSGTQVAKSENVNYSTENIGNGWIRLSVTAPLTANSTYKARFSATNFVGYVYGDAFQLENEKSAATFNIIEDGSFEHQTDFGSTYDNHFWYKTGTAEIEAPLDPNEVLFGEKVLSFPAIAGNQRVSRDVPVNAPLNSTFILSAWAKAAASPKSGATQPAPGNDLNPYFGLILRFYYSDSTSEAHYYPFDPYYRDWQYVQGIAVPEKTGNVTITSITVVAAYDQNINSAYIDNISFRMEPVQTYSYNSDGNLESATQTGTGTQGAGYTGVDLTRYTAANGVQTNYKYDERHNLEKATLGDLECRYTYNNSGNVTGITLAADGTNTYLYSSATITADMNNVASSTNANNITTNYWYNSSEQLTRIIDADDQIFKYSYNENNGRVTKIQHYDSSVFEQNKVAEIEYTYDDENLTQLARKTKASGGSWQYQNYYLEYNDWGQQTKFKVGNHTLTTNTYDNNGGRLTQTKFGTYQTLTYTYDAFDRLTRKEYNNGKYVEYTYNAEGALAKIAYGEGTTPKGSYEFEYDSLGRVLRSAEYDGSGSLVQRIIHNYDAYNRLSSQSWVLGTNTYSESYSYSDGTNGDGSLTQMTTGTGATRHYNYDLLKRLQNVETNYGNTDTVMLKSVYGYRTISGNRSSTQVEYHNVMRGSSYPVKNKYAYDARGNISAVYEDANANGTYRLVAEYEYDEQNQLVEETRYSYANKNATSGTSTTYEYIYDTAGNILKEKQDGVVTKTYYYDDSSWIDLLTGFGDEEDYFSYDSFGNPIDYYNGAYYYIDWYNGRQLTNIDYSSLAEGYHDIHYAYDADGIRNWKSVDDVEHYYTTQNGKVVRETIGSGSTARILDFIYDESGRPFALIDSEGANDPNPDTYYYVLNLQGDVVKLVHILVDNNGVFEYTETAVYTYDAWGNVLSVKNQFGADITDETSIAHVNPLRYRGYYYDRETGWYYLQSRYYDPIIHRFINSDAFASTGQGFLGYNMFAYCLNNPANAVDPTGHSSSTDIDGNGIPDYLDKRWRDLTNAIKMMQALQDMGFSDCSFSSAMQCVNAMEMAQITTSKEKAHFFSQCRVESSLSLLEAGWLNFDSAEAYRKTMPYYPYYGAGYIQLTWEENYKAFSDFMGDPRIYTEGPLYVAENYAWLSAGWIWKTNGINDIIAAGGGVAEVTYSINGGYSQLNDRDYYYQVFLTYWGG